MTVSLAASKAGQCACHAVRRPTVDLRDQLPSDAVPTYSESNVGVLTKPEKVVVSAQIWQLVPTNMS